MLESITDALLLPVDDHRTLRVALTEICSGHNAGDRCGKNSILRFDAPRRVRADWISSNARRFVTSAVELEDVLGVLWESARTDGENEDPRRICNLRGILTRCMVDDPRMQSACIAVCKWLYASDPALPYFSDESEVIGVLRAATAFLGTAFVQPRKHVLDALELEIKNIIS